jgi:hypothetical protein
MHRGRYNNRWLDSGRYDNWWINRQTTLPDEIRRLGGPPVRFLEVQDLILLRRENT